MSASDHHAAPADTAPAVQPLPWVLCLCGRWTQHTHCVEICRHAERDCQFAGILAGLTDADLLAAFGETSTC